MAASPPPTNPCSRLPREQRAACKREQALALQRHWLAQLTWDGDGTAAQVQLCLGLFPVSWRQLPDVCLLERQIATIRRHLGGSYRELLTARLLDPALQISLNGPANHRRKPNENLARELLELFALREGNCREADVRETACALTGYRLTGQGELTLAPRRHDAGAKTILGRTAAFDAVSLAAWLCEQPATARWIAGRLWRQLIGSAPPPQRIAALAAQWQRKKLALPWLMTALQQSPEAKKSREHGLRLADPLELVARTLRLLGSRHPDALAIGVRAAAAMGQPPFEPPNVKGWPANEAWLQLGWVQARRRSLQALLNNEEVWQSRTLGSELAATLTPIPPLTLRLPAAASRTAVGELLADPVWQLA